MSEENLAEVYYQQCDHICDKCPFSNECTHYESGMSGMIDE